MILLSIVFLAGYVAIAFEHGARVNKAATAILMAIFCWGLVFVGSERSMLPALHEHFEAAAEIVIFLLGAMAIVELIDSHRGFAVVTKAIRTRSRRKILIAIGVLSFFLSSVLDNLTTTIVMVSLLRKLVPERKDQMLFGGIVVIAANAGGAWTPIGDVTTTMLWIKGQVSTIGIMKSLVLPSLACLLVPLAALCFFVKGRYQTRAEAADRTEPLSRLVFWSGISALIFVPVFKILTGMPPFMGIMLGLGVLWLITDIAHAKYEDRTHLRVPAVLSKIDISGALFFLGILLAVASLDVTGILHNIATYLSVHLPSQAFLAYFIGLVSALIDNVPLVAATMGMYPLAQFPQDAPLWEMIAYTAGTGGSILVIGSAAGVAFMGLEKVSFGWYFKHISLLALIGYTAGFGVYLLLN